MQQSYKKQKISGLDYLFQKLDLQSGVGRELAGCRTWFAPGQEKELCTELDRIEKLQIFREQDPSAPACLEKIKLKFSQIWDIRATFRLLEKETVDDVQLFEIKRFALLVRETAGLLQTVAKACAFHPAPALFPDLDPVISLLDPRKEGLPTFHIYNEYDPELASKRKELLALDASLAKNEEPEACACALPRGNRPDRKPADEPDTESLYAESPGKPKPFPERDAGTNEEILRLQAECEELERRIRERLAVGLRPFVPLLQQAMDQVAYWDFLIAKAGLAREYGLARPQVLPGGSSSPAACLDYHGLFHPVVRESLQARGGRYQPVDLHLNVEPCLLTGANMSGKTVLMKSLALSQCLLQYGFPVPARSARMVLFDQVELLVEDEQDEERGLSSFGAEMQRFNQVFSRIKAGERILLLADELARTTNPAEGKALVCAVVESLMDWPCISLVSTHYGPIPVPVRHLRVKGFREDWALQGTRANTAQDGNGFDLSRIQACMDYSIVEEKPGEEPPAEALRIAALLDFDPGILQKARDFYRKGN